MRHVEVKTAITALVICGPKATDNTLIYMIKGCKTRRKFTEMVQNF